MYKKNLLAKIFFQVQRCWVQIFLDFCLNKSFIALQPLDFETSKKGSKATYNKV
jgi:hypothetical protein